MVRRNALFELLVVITKRGRRIDGLPVCPDVSIVGTASLPNHAAPIDPHTLIRASTKAAEQVYAGQVVHALRPPLH